MGMEVARAYVAQDQRHSRQDEQFGEIDDSEIMETFHDIMEPEHDAPCNGLRLRGMQSSTKSSPTLTSTEKSAGSTPQNNRRPSMASSRGNPEQDDTSPADSFS